MYVCMYVCTTLRGWIHMKYYPENRDTFEMYSGKVVDMIGG